jgi:hypothetical protein
MRTEMLRGNNCLLILINERENDKTKVVKLMDRPVTMTVK